MADPWRFVDADDDMVADFLAGTVEAVLELGGWIHPAASIVAREGQVRIDLDGVAGDSVPLLRIPAAAFVRITRVAWSDTDEALAMDGLLDELEPAELELLILQMALHNSCGKIPWVAACHPALATDLGDRTIAAVRDIEPGFRSVRRTPAEVFWGNRVLRLPTARSAIPEPVAVPVLDLLNHRAGGATGTWTGDSFEVVAARVPGGSECVLDYGYQRDAIEMAVDYGFVDTSASLAHSAPVSVDVQGVGAVRVGKRTRRADGGLMPVTVEPEPDAYAISGLSFGPTTDTAGELAAASGWSAEDSARAVGAVARANVLLSEQLLEAARAQPEAESARVLAGAAAQHLAVLAGAT